MLTTALAAGPALWCVRAAPLWLWMLRPRIFFFLLDRCVLAPQGSGKSTIASLLQRFYDPTHGEILLDGVPLMRLQVASVRRAVALISQEPFLFSGTLAENIAMVSPGEPFDRAAVEAAAAAAGVSEFADRLPAGLDTVVGVGGGGAAAAAAAAADDAPASAPSAPATATAPAPAAAAADADAAPRRRASVGGLSGGQQQRVAIARALAARPVVLVADEATSSLDAASERVVGASLARLSAESAATVVLIAHRLGTVRHADRILVLDGGRVVEDGTHAELMRVRDGVYASLARLQGVQ